MFFIVSSTDISVLLFILSLIKLFFDDNIFKLAGYETIKSQDPCSLPKACKNDVEINGMKDCHVRDGVAVSKFLYWIDQQVASDNLIDEEELASKLDSLRSEQDLFKGLSFGTISAAGSNAAMCHYSHKNSKIPGKLEMGSIYLVDSGGQYLDGTTDITRTVAIGDVSDEIKRSFTLVFKRTYIAWIYNFPKRYFRSSIRFTCQTISMGIWT